MPHDFDSAHPHSALPPDPVLRVQALETILTQKGLIDPDTLAAIIATYENDIGPQNGARLVAKAWCDQTFRDALLGDPMPLLRDLGYYGRQGEHMVILENTDAQHNMVVCTLCSCYPWPLLGIPPAWYKSDAYRARAGVRASDAAFAMELGATALLMNTAIAHAKDPVKMAGAMRQGVEAGRAAYEAGRMPKRLYASASSPLDGTASF